MDTKPVGIGTMQVTTPALFVRVKPDSRARMETMVMRGELFNIMERKDDCWVYGSPVMDPESKGYARDYGTSFGAPSPMTHAVAVRSTAVYIKPSALDCMSHETPFLGMNARVRVLREQQEFVCIGEERWVAKAHLAPMGARLDWVAQAELFEHSPYVFGSRCGTYGVDCSGLVIAALLWRGVEGPHYSGRLEQYLASRADVVTNPSGPPKRGDLYFWHRHVGIALDNGQFLEATARPEACKTRRGPLAEALKVRGPATSIQRFKD